MRESQLKHAALILTESSTAVPIVKLCRTVGLNPDSIGNRRYLKAGLFSIFKGELTLTHGYFKLRPAPTPESSRTGFKVPDDMWRGWVDPNTGVIPTNLGL